MTFSALALAGRVEGLSLIQNSYERNDVGLISKECDPVGWCPLHSILTISEAKSGRRFAHDGL